MTAAAIAISITREDEDEEDESFRFDRTGDRVLFPSTTTLDGVQVLRSVTIASSSVTY